ncbi:response regulator transcription factor [Allokutzneria multivorans]|uniref:Response regulator transcription factor n=1 Tax=Allokutzneria multivorans TaxID=1142134 RepID=A0ABP7SI79_9PSEU
MITVSAVDDDQMLLDGFTAWLGCAPDVGMVTTARTVQELLEREQSPADVVVLDLFLADGSDPVRNVRRLAELGRKVLVVSVVPHRTHGIDVVRAGARGFLTKDHDLRALTDAVRSVAADGLAHSPELAFAWANDTSDDRPRLSTQERKILVAYASGMTLAAAARRAGVQPATAKKYLDRVKEKYCQAGRATYTKIDLANRVREDELDRYPRGCSTSSGVAEVRSAG